MALHHSHGHRDRARCTRVVLGALLLSTLAAATVVAQAHEPPGQAKKHEVPPGQAKKDVAIEGVLTVAVDDYPQAALVHYDLDTGGAVLAVVFAVPPPPALKTGTKVRVKGTLAPSAVVVADPDDVEILELSSPNTFGEQHTLVVLVNFQDNPAQPYTAADAQALVFGQVSDYYRASSFQQTWLAGDVIGWYTLPISSTVCDTAAIATHAQQAARDAGFDPAAYERLVFAFPQNACGFLGAGSLGGGTQVGYPSQVWINGALSLQAVAHEIGHNFGLWHAHAVACSDGTVGIDLHPPCFVLEYGDTIDNMGFGTGYWGPFSKEQVGWLNFGSSPPITTVAAPGGTFTIEPYETPTLGPKALKIARGDGSFFYVESRQAIGADAFLASTPSALTGVFIRIATPGSGNTGLLYDVTPAATPFVFVDGALQVGQTLTDPVGDVAITPVAVSSAGATIVVTRAVAPPDPDPDPSPCVRTPPLVTILPATRTTLAGVPVLFGVHVANRNSLACGLATFVVTGVVPFGWASFVTVADPLLVVAPGASDLVILHVTSALTALGTYTIGATATESGFPVNTGTGLATVTVTNGPLTVDVSSNAVTYKRKGSVRLSTTVRQNGAAAVGALVSVRVTNPSGGVTTLPAVTDATGTAVVTFKIAPNPVVGVYTALATATTDGDTGAASLTFAVTR